MNKVKFYNYTITDTGEVRNEYNNILKPFKNKNVYNYTVHINGKQKTISAAKLVYTAFNPEVDLTNYKVRTKVKGNFELKNLYLLDLKLPKVHHFNKMKSKEEIVHRMNNHTNKLLKNELLWVLGGIEEEDTFRCENCLEIRKEEEKGTTELALTDNICIYCMQDGYGA